MSFQRPHTIFEYGTKVVCDYPLTTTIDAKLYTGNIVSNIKHRDEGGRVVYLEFDQILSSTAYVNIEHQIIGWFMHGLPLDVTLVNITYENKAISIRLSPYSCGIKGLNVHHHYYTLGSKPWEYTNDALVTLCQDCHYKRHQNAKILLYNTKHQLINHLTICSRCGGSGYLPQYDHIENGICFMCGGEGVILNE